MCHKGSNHITRYTVVQLLLFSFLEQQSFLDEGVVSTLIFWHKFLTWLLKTLSSSISATPTFHSQECQPPFRFKPTVSSSWMFFLDYSTAESFTKVSVQMLPFENGLHYLTLLKLCHEIPLPRTLQQAPQFVIFEVDLWVIFWM